MTAHTDCCGTTFDPDEDLFDQGLTHSSEAASTWHRYEWGQTERDACRAHLSSQGRCTSEIRNGDLCGSSQRVIDDGSHRGPICVDCAEEAHEDAREQAMVARAEAAAGR